MRVAASDITLSARHATSVQHELRETTRAWVGPQRPRFPDDAPRAGADALVLSPSARSAKAGPEQLELIGDVRLQVAKLLLERLFGAEFDLFDPGALEAPESAAPPADARQGWGVEYDRYESYSEQESLDFAAAGVIETVDGQRIEFEVSLSLRRSYFAESSTSLRLGDAARALKDPLVLNFGGTAAQVTQTRFAFDIDFDGNSDQVAGFGPGSALLVLDRNANGEVDDGRELFGPASGDGFAELEALDDDGNHWLDEADAGFSRLRLWSREADGSQRLVALGQRGVGAIWLGRIETPFSYTDGANELLGQARSTGLFVGEHGSVGTVQQIDLVA